MSWLLPASICILVAMSLLGAVFGYLYLTYRERYLKYWMLFTLASSMRYLFLISQVTLGKSPALAAAYNLATVVGAAFAVAGAQIFAYKRISRWFPYPFALGALWAVTTPFYNLSPPLISTVIFFLLGWALIYVGVMFLRHATRARTATVYFTSGLFILWGVHQFDYPILRFVDWFAPIGYAIGGTFALATSLGVILTYFEMNHQDLIEREENFKALFENAADSVLILDPATLIPTLVDVNRSTLDLYGYTREELVGKPISVLDAEVLDEATALERVGEVKSKGFHNFRVNHRCKDGSVKILDVAAKHAKVGGRDMVISSERDVTDLVKAEEERDRLNEQLAHAQKMESVGRLAGGVAHDFNNMLGVIIGHAEFAMDSLDPESSTYQDLAEVTRAATRSAELTRQLLAFARKQTSAPRQLNLNECVEDALKMLRRLVGEAIALEWQPSPNLWRVKLDPAQVDQVLSNLVVNAQDAIAGVGTVSISTSMEAVNADRCGCGGEAKPGEYVVLSVSDDGCGMDPETLSKAFEPFFTTKELGKGTGLGLSTVYGIVHQNGGFVTVNSTPGKGTTFNLHFPRDLGQESSLRGPDAADAPEGGTETILLVEDEESLLAMNKRILKEMGYCVLTATSPEDALKLASLELPRVDLLLTDVVMPVMDGRSLARILKKMKPSLRCVFMSGYSDTNFDPKGSAESRDIFLQKPFKRAELARKVRQALGKGA